MPDITDPAAIKFVNEQIRPICEQLRALKARITAAKIDWFAGLNNVITNTSDPVVDGREAEGINQLLGTDINSEVSIFIAVADATNDEIIAKPCVRPLQVTTPGA